MTKRQKAEKWISEYAYYLWLNGGGLHGDHERHHAEARAAWDKLQAKAWRSWNKDAQAELSIPLPKGVDPRRYVDDMIRAFFKLKKEDGPVKRINYRGGYLTIWLDKSQPDGYEYDWRTCDLPKGWDAPVTEPRVLTLNLHRYVA